MTQHPDESFQESEIPLFDVVVKMTSTTDLETVERLARDAAGLAPNQVAGLIKALRNGPQVKIGAGVSQDRADKAREQFSKAGLTVTVTPLLTLQTKKEGAFDGLYVCPACRARVTLPMNRQCPACNVFVDKVTEEFLLKRKIMEQERGALEFKEKMEAKANAKRVRQAIEAAIREEVRKELAAEFGQTGEKGLFSGKTGLLRATGLVGMLALAFVGGKALPQSGLPWGKTLSTPSASTPADIDTMLDKIGPKSADPTQAAASTGDSDIDDLLAHSGGNRTGKGISLEQALAAANTLGKAVGNTTAERAWAGTAGNTAGAAGATDTPGAKSGTGAIPPQTKWLLAAEFAKRLAELGQVPRALDVIKQLKAMPELASAPVFAAAVRVADLEVQAWALGALGESRARSAAETLKSDAAALADPAERAQALGRVGVILSHHTQLPVAASHAFLTLAAESLKQVANTDQRSRAIGDWTVALGEVLLTDVTLQAKRGLWSKAKAAAEQLDSLIKQTAAGPTQAQLYAMDYQANLQLGQGDKANQSLAMAIASAGKNANTPEQAARLRAVAQHSGAGALEPVQTAVNALLAQLEPQSGLEKAQALTQLALLQADAGLRAKSDQYGRLAQATPGMSPAEAVTINANLIVQGDMAAAMVLHRQDRYAESEVLLQRLAGYLF